MTTSTRMVWLRSDGTSLPLGDDADLALLDLLESERRRCPSRYRSGPTSRQSASPACRRSRSASPLIPSSLPRPSTMVWVVAPPVEYEMVVLSVGVPETLDGQIRAHVEKNVAGAGEVGAEYADRRALGERAQHPWGPDIDAEIGAAGNHRLDRFARAGGAEIFERDPVFPEDAGLLAEDRRLPAPDFELTDCDLEGVLRGTRPTPRWRSATASEKRQERALTPHGLPPSTLVPSDRALLACLAPYFLRGGIWMNSASCSLVNGASMNLSFTASR